jgi:hypothetical protein
VPEVGNLDRVRSNRYFLLTTQLDGHMFCFFVRISSISILTWKPQKEFFYNGRCG